MLGGGVPSGGVGATGGTFRSSPFCVSGNADMKMIRSTSRTSMRV